MYRNQSIDLPSKSMDWFLYDIGLRHERVKGMCVLLFDVFKHLLLKKTDVLKTCRKSKFFGKKIWRNALVLRTKRSRYRENLYFGIIIFSVYKTMSRISFKLFCLGDKRLYHSHKKRKDLSVSYNYGFIRVR